MVQLVRGLLLESLVRGSTPLAEGLLLESLIRGWGPTCLAIAYSGLEYRESWFKTIRLVRDRTPGIGHKSDWLVTNLLPAKFGRWWQDSSNYGKG